ncbi:MAG: methionyl-tRNA formyltransferase [Rikenellaceae bacterium]|jgi:methionyl-tRNA formyltransferase|nr:methionyl-tRNA formyltransferase [Rikenellaceae bacterium]
MDAKSLRIVYMGTPDFAVMPLRALVESGYNVVAVVTTPDKPAGRGLKVQESAVKQYAQAAGLPILQPEKLRDPAFLEALTALAPDLGIVIAFRMLPQVVWQLPRLGTFNLHASLLPQYRGAAPINWAIINGEATTGVTTFLLNAEIDKGAILGQRPVAIDPEENAGSLHDRLMVAGTELVLESVQKIAAGEVSPIEQAQLESGPLREAPKIFKDDCRIRWNDTAAAIHNRIRGLSPYPTAWTELVSANERIGVKIFAAKMLSDSQESNLSTTPTTHPGAPSGSPGTIHSDNKTFIEVATRDGALRIDELQLSGKKRMTTRDFLLGFKEIDRYHFE